MLPLTLLLVTTCSRPEQRPASHHIPIFIISIDTLRSDRIGAYGYRDASTPNLDRFRTESVLFEHAFSHVPQTLPSHATLFGGTLPPTTGVRDNLGYALPENAPTLPQILKDHGYVTGAAVSSYVLRRATGIGRGFDFFDDEVEAEIETGPTAAERNGDRTRELFENWLTGVSGDAVFGFLHIFEPHAPYRAPQEYAAKDPYDGEVAYADAIVGRFFETLRRRGLYDRALIVVLSDHGEGLGDHGEDEHGFFVYRESIQVPLMVRLPNAARAGTSARHPVGLFDLAPTVLSLAGIAVPPQMQGINILSNGLPSRDIYSETYYPRLHFAWHELRSMIGDRFHYIDAPKRELYDYVADRGETANIIAEQRRIAAAMAASLAAIKSDFALPKSVDPEEQRKLAALGYIGSTVGTGENLPDPKDNIHFVRMFAEAAAIVDAGRDREAVARLTKLTRESPRMVDAWALLARSYRRLGQPDRALDALRQALRLFPQNPHVGLALADLLFSMGHYQAAKEHALLAAPADPARAHAALAEMELQRGDIEDAERNAVLALRESPDRAATLRLLAVIRKRQLRFAEELDLLDRASGEVERLRLEPIPGLHYDRGRALLQLGRGPEAEAAFAREKDLFPKNIRAWADLALVRSARGDALGARQTLQEMLRVRSDREARRVAAEARQIIDAGH